MKLLTKEIIEKLPLLKDLEDPITRDTLVPVKFFNPTGSGTWYVLAIDGENKEINDDTILFGIAHIQSLELGSFSYGEIKDLKVGFGLKIERDMWWNQDFTLLDVNNEVKRHEIGNLDWLMGDECYE